jgi:hypothetical protein
MSSSGPMPRPGAEELTRYVDALRRQQQEMATKLTLAQQQAAKTFLTKTPPAPGMTTEALKVKLNDQLTTLATTVQRQQALGEALTKGDMKAVQIGMIIGQVQGALERAEQELQASLAQVQTLEEVRTQELLQLQQMAQTYQLAATLASTVAKELSNQMKSVVQKIG